MQAKIENQKKWSQYHRDSLKYWNREVSHRRGIERIATGLSRAKSDAYVKALYALGRGRLASQEYAKEIAAARGGTGATLNARDTTVSKRAGRNDLLQALNKQSRVESAIDNEFGAKMDARMTKIDRFSRRALAKNREQLGVRPEFGEPVQLPPKGDTTMANLGMFLSIAQMGIGLAALSDIRLKENIDEVGQSPTGYKIYEWNYKSDKNTRYRGAIAQDVVKINPMAVGIRDNYLTVDYNKIDVNMEVIS